MILVAALVAAAMWDPEATRAWASDAGVIGVALGVVLVGWMGGRWLRKRQRRRMLGMRDSALW
jgi:MFS family permease